VNFLPVPATTHTVELEQLKALNEILAKGNSVVTAERLGLGGVAVSDRSDVTLPGAAVLVHLGSEGPPEFPYIQGYFDASVSTGTRGRPATFAVNLHTQALRELSRHLGLRQRWGF
jgi:hypothetical protein